MYHTFTKNVLLILLSSILALNVSADFLLYKNKQPQAVLLVKNKADKLKLQGNINLFSAELKKHAVKELPVFVGKAPAGKNIVSLVLKDDPNPLKTFDFVIDFPAKNQMRITGNSTSAIRFAFHHILDAHAKRRIYVAPSKVVKGELNDYPPIQTLAIPRKTFRDGPAFPIRFTAGRISGWNGGCMYWGGHFLGAFAFPVTKYYDNNSWPEEIMPTLANGQKFNMPKPKKTLKQIFGRKVTEGHYARLIRAAFNPCWSAKATEDIAVANLLEAIQRRPDLKTFVIDISDCGQCKCKRCLERVGDKRTVTGHMNYSDLYWKWVSNVAKRINAKYPHIMFMGMAYREMLSAPSFKLPETVITCLCFELSQMVDPKAAALRRGLMKEWGKKCSYLTMYGYGHGGWDCYFLPRIYSHVHDKVFKEFYSKYNLRGYHHEGYAPVSAINGPENYVVNALLWNPGTDVELLLQEWYEGMVGKKAAPYLKEFCQFWENYWTGKEIRKTPWFESSKAIYYALGDHTHTFALQKGDMAYCRKLVNQILANAETPAQKKRALLLSGEFEASELAAKALFAEQLNSDGSISGTKKACEVIRALPEAAKAMKEFLKHPVIVHVRKKDLFERIESYQLLAFSSVFPYLNDPVVAREFAKLKNEKSLPETMQACIRFFSKDKSMVNKYPNASFESIKYTQRLFQRHLGNRVLHTTEVAHSGKYSMKLSNGLYSFRVDALPGEKYLVVVWAYTNKPSSEGKLSYRLGPCHLHKKTGPHFLRWYRVDNLKVPGKQWIPLVISGEVPLNAMRGGGKGNSIWLYLDIQRYEDDEFIYIDDVSFIKL